MPNWLSDLPFVVALAVLTGIAVVRGQVTYWLARWATERAVGPGDGAGWRRHPRRWLDGPEALRGRRLLERWGLPLIPLAYLTVGFQTVLLASAGVLRIGWGRFTLAQLPGALVWGGIYATIGFAAWEAAIGAAAASPRGRGPGGAGVDGHRHHADRPAPPRPALRAPAAEHGRVHSIAPSIPVT